MTIAALKALCLRISWCEPAVLESVLELALEIVSRESAYATCLVGSATTRRASIASWQGDGITVD
jgi:hypothetical protein